MAKEIENKMRELVDKLNAASDAYYGGGGEILPNKEWDRMFDELTALETEAGYALPDSPTQNVGSESFEGAGEEEPHEYPALSLAKSQDVTVIQKWAGGKLIWISWKLDGLTLILTYDNGKLVKILTRGKGLKGHNVTHLKGVIKGIPLTIPFKGHLVVRGEATISYEDFERVNANLPEGARPYANPRNLASGTIALGADRLDEVKERGVQLTAFTLVAAAENGEERDLQYWGDRMTWLENQGFDVVEREFCYARELPDIIEKWSEKVRSGAMQTPVDGLVAVYDDTIYASGFTVTGHHDNGAGMAFKWPDKMKTAVLDHIEWSCGATCITPVAIFSPVELEGTRVTRASMHNISEAKRIGVGANGVTELSVYKANMIVPQVASADAKGSEPFEIPDRCPVCGSPTEIRISETKTRSGVKTVETLHCMNPDCIAKHLKKFARFVSKDGMNVEGLSQKKIADLISGGFIASYLDLMRLPYLPYTHGAVMDSCGNKLEDRDGWGKTSVENLLSAVQKSKVVDMEHLLYSLSIPMCGHHVSKLLLRTWHSKDLVDKINNDLSGLHASMQHIEGVGEKKADAFRAWFESSANLQLFNDLLDEVDLKSEEKKEEVSASCAGLTFVITGSVHSFKNRSEFAKYVETHGGKVAGSVSKNTSYLVSNEPSTSSKSLKAAKLGVPVLTEDEFIARF